MTRNPFVCHWDIESLTDASKSYSVSKRLDGSFACSCPAWKFHRAPKVDCKHIRFVKDSERAPDMTRRTPDNWTPPPAIALMRAAELPKLQPRVTVPSPPAIEPEPVSTYEFAIRRKFRATA
jgi:hypothetical protein